MNITKLPADVQTAALRAAARALIWCLQAMPELQGVYVAIIGGLAVQNYVEARRKTLDVDVLLFHPARPVDTQRIRKELVSGFSYRFVECAQPLYFKYRYMGNIYLVQVDIIPQHLPPYLPTHAVALGEVDLDHLPFVAPLDLLVYKVHCSSMRPTAEKRSQDARDVRMLWGLLYNLRFVALNPAQRDAIVAGVHLMEESTPFLHWIKERLRQWVNV